ncbi:MAG: PilZ domain-containing protein [Myxococcota bacterium]
MQQRKQASACDCVVRLGVEVRVATECTPEGALQTLVSVGAVVRVARLSCAPGGATPDPRSELWQQHQAVLDELHRGRFDDLMEQAGLRSDDGDASELQPLVAEEHAPREAHARPNTRLLHLSFQDTSTFLAAHIQESDRDGLLVRSTLDLPVGQLVELHLDFPGLELPSVRVAGRVTWRRFRPRRTSAAYLGILAEPRDQPVLRRALAAARTREGRSVQRRHPRIPTSLAVEVTSQRGVVRSGSVTDISEGGAYVAVDVLAPVGSVVGLRFKPDRSAPPSEVKGLVIWHAATGQGMGVMFLFTAPAQRHVVQLLMEHKARAALDGDSPR